jgi:hypothetical protein
VYQTLPSPGVFAHSRKTNRPPKSPSPADFTERVAGLLCQFLTIAAATRQYSDFPAILIKETQSTTGLR